MKSETEFLHESYHVKDKKLLLNTFLSRVPAEKSLEWWINREKDLKLWNKILKDSNELNKNYLCFIIGSYGRGKTLALYKISEEVKQYPELYSANLNFLGEEKSTGGLDFIFRIFRNIDFYKLIHGKDTKTISSAIENIPDSFSDAKHLLKSIYENETKIGFFSDFVETPKARSDLSKIALLFLQGEKNLNAKEMKSLNIQRKIDKTDNAKKYLAGILIFIKNIGYNALVLTIDEFEYLFSLVSSNQRSIYIALLRGLYDLSSELKIDSTKIANLVFFIAVSEDGWVNLKNLEQKELSSGGPTVPLLDRLDSNSTLGSFNKSNTLELISKRLRYNREGDYSDEPLIPFTSDFVEYIFKNTRGEPRDIITQCGIVLDMGIAQRIPKLTKKFAQQVIEQNIE
jgi:Cdc6-like AAA superfamily ATPase